MNALDGLAAAAVCIVALIFGLGLIAAVTLLAEREEPARPEEPITVYRVGCDLMVTGRQPVRWRAHRDSFGWRFDNERDAAAAERYLRAKLGPTRFDRGAVDVTEKGHAYYEAKHLIEREDLW